MWAAVLRDGAIRVRDDVPDPEPALGQVLVQVKACGIYGVPKQLSVQFCFDYDPMEFAECLRSIAEGALDVTPMITGEVDLDGLPGAFDELADPERHCKILVVP